MARVKKCDRCGVIYDNNIKAIEIPFLTDESNYHAYRTVSEISIKMPGYPVYEYPFDLCDDCAEKLINFLSQDEYDEGN